MPPFGHRMREEEELEKQMCGKWQENMGKTWLVVTGAFVSAMRTLEIISELEKCLRKSV